VRAGSKAGYPIRTTQDAFELKAIERSLIDKVSLRTAEIECLAAQIQATPWQKARLGATSREPKAEAETGATF